MTRSSSNHLQVRTDSPLHEFCLYKMMRLGPLAVGTRLTNLNELLAQNILKVHYRNLRTVIWTSML